MGHCKDCEEYHRHTISRGECKLTLVDKNRLDTCENFERSDRSDRTCRDCEMFAELPPDRQHYSNVVYCNCPVPPQFESGFIVNTIFAEVCELYTPKE